MRNKFLLLLTAMLLTMYSCHDSDSLTQQDNDEPTYFDNCNNLIEKDTKSISISDAMKMARKLISSEGVSRATYSDDITIETIQDYITNTPLLYIINYGSDNGYAIISATKNYMPLLAFSDKGHFNQSDISGAAEYIDKYKEDIISSISDKSDSLRNKYSLDWAVYENNKNDLQITSRSTSSDLINAEIKKKEALGYTYIGKLSALSSYLPADEYNTVVMDISQHTDATYDYEDVSLVFVESFNYEEKGPLIGTRWGQREPFNVDAPNGYAGCVPIAVAQILYYYQYPSKYNWSNIYMYPVSNDDFNYFIKDVRSLCKVEYKEGATGSNIKKARSAFIDLGYNATISDYVGVDILRNEITNSRPVFLRGDNGDTGHAWVCEGYQHQKYKATISMIIDKKYGRPNTGSKYFDYELFINPTSAKDDTSTREYFYMNFGWRGDDNGWYIYNGYSNRTNYTKNQKALIIQKP